MVTKKRPWYAGAYYHITSRGNRKELIFLDNTDYGIYLWILKNTLDFYTEYGYKLLCYCLMSNHIHLLLKTSDKHPSFFMRRVNSLYAKYFNEKYNYTGHLFEKRYYSNLINSDIELLEVSKYIHLNPVKACIVNKPEDYKWSSYRKILSNKPLSKDSIYIHFDEILHLMNTYSLNINTPHLETTPTNAKYKMYVDRNCAPEA